MRYHDRKEFTYDPQLFHRYDVITAKKLHRQYTEIHSPRNPLPQIFEVDRKSSTIDPVWNYETKSHNQFSRTLDVPGIYKQDKLNWSLRKYGQVAEQKINVILSALTLETLDYFPSRGDIIYYGGYRWAMTDIDMDPAGFWQQTNVWLGLAVVAVIDYEGDARPLANPGEAAPAELSQSAPVQVFSTLPSGVPAQSIPSTPFERY